MSEMKDRVALVTGAASGIGQASAVAFAARGASVIVCDIADGTATVEMITKKGGKAHFVRMDVTKSDEVQGAVKETVSRYGRLDFAHNNAGHPGPAALLHEWSLEDFEKVMRINAYGTFLCMKFEIEQMLKQGKGAMVNTASTAGLRGLPSMPGYSASKHAVVGLTKAAAVDYGRYNIRVNAICPGAVRTPMMMKWIDGDAKTEALMSNNPQGRMAESSEQAEVAVWLCSDGASHVSGVCMAVDAGLLAGAASGGK
jgi:NAD(P)-dependent dehydrogenase (short-subunit alcohol dehydrogenase family)